MAKKAKTIPKFKTEPAERKFWESHNSTEYAEWRRHHIQSGADAGIMPDVLPKGMAGVGKEHYPVRRSSTFALRVASFSLDRSSSR